jgi:O-antigen/teichoic acid export membrane protein
VSTQSALRRVGWNLVDQVISSGTNAALSFLVARSVSSADFGGFAVAFTVFSLSTGVSRAVSTSPMGVRFTSVPPAEFALAAGASVGSAFALGVLTGLGCLVAGGLVGGAAGVALVALGVVLPGLLSQDAWRLVFFAEGRPKAAALNDAVWAVFQLGAVGALVVSGSASIGLLVGAWGLSAGAAAVLGLRQSAVRPRPTATVNWLRTHRNLTGYVLAEYVTLQGAQQAALLVIASVASLEAIGALRGAQVILGPITILSVGVYSFALPEFSRRRSTLSIRGWLRGGLALSAFGIVAAVSWGSLFFVLPDSVGEALLGASWTGTQSVLLPSLVGMCGSAAAAGPGTLLLAMDRARVTFWGCTVLAFLLLTLGVGGVLIGGATGAAWGFAAAFCLMVVPWWTLLVREVRRTVVTASHEVEEPSRP